MKKLHFIALCLCLSFFFACSKIKNVVGGNNLPPKMTMPVILPIDGIKNSVPDAHLGEETAFVVSVLPDGQYYIGADEFRLDSLGDVINGRLSKNPSEKQLVYLNGDALATYYDVVKALDSIRRANVENVALRVAPNVENAKGYYVLKTKLPPEPKEGDKTETSRILIVNLSKDGKTSIGKYDKNYVFKAEKSDIKPEELSGKIAEAFNASPDKIVYIKASPESRYDLVAHLVDAAVGAGASAVYLQIDDLFE